MPVHCLWNWWWQFVQTTGVKSIRVVFEHSEQMVGPGLLSTSPAMRSRSRTSRRGAGPVFKKGYCNASQQWTGFAGLNTLAGHHS